MEARNKKFETAFIEFFKRLMDSLSRLNEKELPKNLETEIVFNENGFPDNAVVEEISFRDLTTQMYSEFKNWPIYRDLKNAAIFIDAAGNRFKDKNAFHLNNNFIPQMIHKFYQKSGNTFNCNIELIKNQYTEIENGIYRNLKYTIKVPLFNIELENEKAIKLRDNIFIQKMSQDDHKLFIRLYGNLPHNGYIYYSNLSTIINIETTSNRKTSANTPTTEHYRLFTSLAVSLALFKKNLIYYGVRCITAKNFWRIFEGITFHGLFNLPMAPLQSSRLRTNETDEFVAFWKKFHKTMVSYSWMEIACERLLKYHQSCSEKRFDQDNLIDLMTILEILYLPTGDGELKFRLSTSCAKLLGKNHRERINIFNNVSLAYDIRSDLIHTGHLRKSSIKKLNKYNLKLQDLIRTVEKYTYDSFCSYTYDAQKRDYYIDVLLK